MFLLGGRLFRTVGAGIKRPALDRGRVKWTIFVARFQLRAASDQPNRSGRHRNKPQPPSARFVTGHHFAPQFECGRIPPPILLWKWICRVNSLASANDCCGGFTEVTPPIRRRFRSAG